jgi:hypothetical protein
MFKTLNGYTKQTIIDKINSDFKGKASTFTISGVDQCQYLTDDGRKCSIGLFIPNGHRGDNRSWVE